jgi:hypothetical protein
MVAEATMKLPPPHAAAPLRALASQQYFMGHRQKLETLFDEKLNHVNDLQGRAECMRNLTLGSAGMDSPARAPILGMLAGHIDKVPQSLQADRFCDVLGVAKYTLNPADMKPAMDALAQKIHCCPPQYVPTAMCALVLQDLKSTDRGRRNHTLQPAERVDVMVKLANSIENGDKHAGVPEKMFDMLIGFQENHQENCIPDTQRLQILSALSRQLVHLPPDEQCRTALNLLSHSDTIASSPDRSALLNQIQRFAEHPPLGVIFHQGQLASGNDLLRHAVSGRMEADLTAGRTSRPN